MQKDGTRVLLYDIETAPAVAYAWEKTFDQDIIKFISYQYILMFGYRWLGSKTTKVVSIDDFKRYKRDPRNDIEVVKALRDLFNEADVIVGHNIKRYDNKWLNRQLIKHKEKPVKPYRVVDTWQVAVRYFKFPSNSLAVLAEFLGLKNKKLKTDFGLWEGCMDGSSESFKRMKKYCRVDVDTLEEVYLRLRPFDLQHPNFNVLNAKPNSCPKCTTKGVMKINRYYPTKAGKKAIYLCSACGSYSTGGSKRVKEVEVR